jgi:Exonuclease
MTDWTSLSYAVVDVEGNGQQPPDLVALAVVPIVGGVIGEPQSWLVRPERSIKYFATCIHGLTNDDVADQPPFAAVDDEVRAALAVPALIAHNAQSSTRSGSLVGYSRSSRATSSACWSKSLVWPRACQKTSPHIGRRMTCS